MMTALDLEFVGGGPCDGDRLLAAEIPPGARDGDELVVRDVRRIDLCGAHAAFCHEHVYEVDMVTGTLVYRGQREKGAAA